MSREYPDWVDPWKAADGRRSFAGSMPLGRMKRLAGLLADTTGEANFSAAFEYDAQSRVTIRIEVETRLPLICQRSLEPYLEAVKRQSLLGVIEDMSEEHQVPDSYEPVLVEHGHVALLDLVEDELLLAVPQVPKNPEIEEVYLDGLEPHGPALRPETANVKQPFAGLAEQMKQHAGVKKEKP